MDVLMTGSSGSHLLAEGSFADEAELQRVLFENPGLIARPADNVIRSVKRELELPEAGALDLLAVTSDGLPIAVEVKLGRNGESRRQVVAQVIDYVAALTLLTVDELDQRVGGALEVVLREIAESEQGPSFDQLWAQVGANLRAGQARVILALDDAPEGLVRIARFLAQRSDLDLGLLAVRKFADKSNGALYVPTYLVDTEQDGGTVSRSVGGGARAELLAVASAWDENSAPGWKTSSSAGRYRKVSPPGWPAGVHYEFLMTQPAIGTELHIEDERWKHLAGPLSALHGRALPGGAKLEWEPKWFKGCGRLMAKHPIATAPTEIVTAMQALIELTRPIVEQHVSRKQA